MILHSVSALNKNIYPPGHKCAYAKNTEDAFAYFCGSAVKSTKNMGFHFLLFKHYFALIHLPQELKAHRGGSFYYLNDISGAIRNFLTKGLRWKRRILAISFQLVNYPMVLKLPFEI